MDVGRVLVDGLPEGMVMLIDRVGRSVIFSGTGRPLGQWSTSKADCEAHQAQVARELSTQNMLPILVALAWQNLEVQILVHFF